MRIEKRHTPQALELIVEGRLDAYWADHLGAAIEESLRSGGHRLRVDMAGVVYMSSAGIRILLRFRKQVQGLGGSFVVVNPSEAVRSVLEMVGLAALLADATEAEARGPSSATREFACGEVVFEVFGSAPPAPVNLRLVGSPNALVDTMQSPLVSLRLDASMLALGVGMLGDDADSGSERAGEFLSAAGAVTYLPADGTGVADYVVAEGALQPQAQVLYAAVCDMSNATLLRFEAPKDRGEIGLNALAQAALAFAGSDAAAMVLVAETVGLLGAALRRSPSGNAGRETFSFGFPEVRSWLSFTPERVFARSVALVTGVVSTASASAGLGVLRPLAASGDLHGHFHAAAFAYRPLRKGSIDLRGTVRGLFDDGAPLGILHLLNDDRPIVGSGESLFVRGACWVTPICGVERG